MPSSKAEIRQRQSTLLPPYGRLAALIVSARDKELAALVARDLAQCAPAASRIEVLGPAEAPLAVIRRPSPLAAARQGAA
mgnify:CR=1 FL=1